MDLMDLLDLERKLWDANVAGDGEFYAKILRDDAVVVSPWGTMTKEQAVPGITANHNPYTRYEITEPLELPLGRDGGLITYGSRCTARATPASRSATRCSRRRPTPARAVTGAPCSTSRHSWRDRCGRRRGAARRHRVRWRERARHPAAARLDGPGQHLVGRRPMAPVARAGGRVRRPRPRPQRGAGRPVRPGRLRRRRRRRGPGPRPGPGRGDRPLDGWPDRVAARRAPPGPGPRRRDRGHVRARPGRARTGGGRGSPTGRCRSRRSPRSAPTTGATATTSPR